MNGEDFKRLEQIIVNFKDDMKGEFSRFKDEIKTENSNFKEYMKAEFSSFKDEIKTDNISFKDEMKSEFRHQLGIQSEHFQHKLDIVVEGHDLLRKEIRDTREELSEKIKLVDFKVEVLNQKIDDVAADLSAHRRDTEAHPSLYKIKEGT